MKFSCPSCQAKYQIAEDKVSGRAMKMKCRKCGAIIPISEDGSISDNEAQRLSTLPRMSAAPPAPVPKPSALGANQPAAGPVVRAPAPRTPAAQQASVAPKPASPRPATGGGPAAAVRPLAAPARAAAPATRAAAPAPRVARPSVDVSIREPQVAPEPDFEANSPEFAGPPSMRRVASKMPVAMPEWHAGIDGTAAGPMTREELRQQIKNGHADAETLVWRDGMTGWASLGEVPDVADLLTRITALPSGALFAGGDSALAASAPSLFVLDATSLPVPSVALPAAFEAPPPPTRSAAPLAPSAPPHRDSMWEVARHKPISRSVIGFVGVALLASGLALGFVLFGGQETKIIKQLIEVPAAAPLAENAPPPPTEAEVGGEDAAATTGTKPTSGTGKSSTPGSGSKPSTIAPTTGLSGLSGLAGLGSSGPQTGPGTTSPGAPSGQPLESSQVQSTVARYQNAVKRGCWEPALSARDADAPSSARVTVSITVASTGGVQSASSTGDPKGYRGLASCIERRVQTWSFPRSSGTTTVKVPFVFAAQ